MHLHQTWHVAFEMIDPIAFQGQYQSASQWAKTAWAGEHWAMKVIIIQLRTHPRVELKIFKVNSQGHDDRYKVVRRYYCLQLWIQQVLNSPTLLIFLHNPSLIIELAKTSGQRAKIKRGWYFPSIQYVKFCYPCNINNFNIGNIFTVLNTSLQIFSCRIAFCSGCERFQQKDDRIQCNQRNYRRIEDCQGTCDPERAITKLCSRPTAVDLAGGIWDRPGRFYRFTNFYHRLNSLFCNKFKKKFQE